MMLYFGRYVKMQIRNLKIVQIKFPMSVARISGKKIRDDSTTCRVKTFIKRP